MCFSNTLLPQPLGPMTTVVLPGWIARSTPFSTTSPSKALWTPSSRMMGLSSSMRAEEAVLTPVAQCPNGTFAAPRAKRGLRGSGRRAAQR